MNCTSSSARIAVTSIVVSLFLAAALHAQAPARPATPEVAPKQAAPIDLTGYWVAVVTEDWRWRMVTPAKGDYASVPINLAAKTMADKWDPSKDEAAGEQCRSYGAPAIMRVPGRLHITWQDDRTLKVEIDAGEQTRLLRFDEPKTPAGAPTWQGISLAKWETPRAPALGAGDPQPKTAFGDLKVTTTHLRPGYLRKNGIPYSDKTQMTEYWDLSTEHYLTGTHNGEQWLVVTTQVTDPTYLQEDWVTSLHFRKEPDGSKWDPEACSAKW